MRKERSKTNQTDSEKGIPKFAIAAIIIVIVAAVVFIVMTQKKSYVPVVAGGEAIDFTLPDLDGNPKKLSDYRGKVVFLNFWATWCKPCEEEMPSMQALYEGLGNDKFEIIAVSVDKDGPETVAPYVKKYGITFPVLHDRKGKIKETYKTTGVPETFIIDQNGVVAEKVWGPRDWTLTSPISTILDLLKDGPKPKEAHGKRTKTQ